MKVQEPGKATPINSNYQLDKKEFYQAIQKYGEQAKTDGTSNGNVANFLQKAGNENFAETKSLQTQLLADSYAPGAITAACSTFSSPTVCSNGYSYDINKARISTSAANYNANCCIITPTCTNGITIDVNGHCGLDSYTKLLLHFNNNLSDSSASGNTVSSIGSIKTSATKVKFGATSLYNNGTTTGIQTASSSDFVFGTSNFTIDMQIYPIGAGDNWRLFNISSADGITNTDIIVDLASTLFPTTLRVITGNDGSGTGWSVKNLTTSTISLNNWNHIALVRNGSDLSLYVNGVKNLITSSFAINFNKASSRFTIATHTFTTEGMNAYYDEIRISKGIARWTSDFSSALPTGEYY